MRSCTLGHWCPGMGGCSGRHRRVERTTILRGVLANWPVSTGPQDVPIGGLRVARAMVVKKASRSATGKPVASPVGKAKPTARKPSKPSKRTAAQVVATTLPAAMTGGASPAKAKDASRDSPANRARTRAYVLASGASTAMRCSAHSYFWRPYRRRAEIVPPVNLRSSRTFA